MLLRKITHSQRGDTLVEVLFSTAVAALVIMAALAVMNRNFAIVQMSVETTLVRQAIDGEAEVLRYLRDQYNISPTSSAAQPWKEIIDDTPSGNKLKQAASTFGTCPSDANFPASAFYIQSTKQVANSSGDSGKNDAVGISDLRLNTTAPTPAETYARIGQGIWVEAVEGNKPPASEAIRYVDLHIRACWDPPFDGPKATLGTIVRLYYEK